MYIQNHVAVIGDHAFTIDRIATQLDDLPGHMAACHRDHLDGERKGAKRFYQLAAIGNADKGASYRSNDFFPGQRRAAAFDQLQMLVRFVGAVNVIIKIGNTIEVMHLDTVLPQPFSRCPGAGDRAIKEPFVLC